MEKYNESCIVILIWQCLNGTENLHSAVSDANIRELETASRVNRTKVRELFQNLNISIEIAYFIILSLSDKNLVLSCFHDCLLMNRRICVWPRYYSI